MKEQPTHVSTFKSSTPRSPLVCFRYYPYLATAVATFICLVLWRASGSISAMTTVPTTATAAAAIKIARHTNGKEREQLKFYNNDATPVSYGAALRLLADNPAFRQQLTAELAASRHDAYFFETPPVSRQTLAETNFECVLISSDTLAQLQEASPEAFSHRLREAAGQSHLTAHFANLGGDAVLVAPVGPFVSDKPDQSGTAGSSAQGEIMAGPQTYAHLASFVRQASRQEIDDFWQTAAQVTLAHLEARSETKPLWLSTSGLGVYWLHLRLDDRPKYYNFEPYMQWTLPV